MNAMTKEMINIFKGKIPDIIIWVILCAISIVVLQKNDEIQDIQIVEAQTEIQSIQGEYEKDRDELLEELKDIDDSIEENIKDERERYEDIIQRLSTLER